MQEAEEKKMRAASKKTVLRGRERHFANGKILQSYVRRNILESVAPEAPGIADFYPRDLRNFRLRPVMAPNCEKPQQHATRARSTHHAR